MNKTSTSILMLFVTTVLFYLLITVGLWEYIKHGENRIFHELPVQSDYPWDVEDTFELSSNFITFNTNEVLSHEKCKRIPVAKEPSKVALSALPLDTTPIHHAKSYHYDIWDILKKIPSAAYIALLALVFLITFIARTGIGGAPLIHTTFLLSNVALVFINAIGGLAIANASITENNNYQQFYDYRGLLLRVDESLRELGWKDNPLKDIDRNLLKHSIIHAIATNNYSVAASYAAQVPSEYELERLQALAYTLRARKAFEDGQTLIALNYSIVAEKIVSEKPNKKLVDHLRAMHAYESSISGKHGYALNILRKLEIPDKEFEYSIWSGVLHNHLVSSGVINNNDVDFRILDHASALLQTYIGFIGKSDNKSLVNKVSCLYVTVLGMQAKERLANNKKLDSLELAKAKLTYIPDDAETYELISSAYHATAIDKFEDSDKEEAINLAKQALGYAPEDADIFEFLAISHLSLATDFFISGNKHLAIKYGKQGLEYMPEDLAIKDFIGNANYSIATDLANDGKKLEAVRYALEALSFIPSDNIVTDFLRDVYFSIAVDSYNTGEKYDAIKYANKALEYRKDEKSILDFRANTHYSIGIDAYSARDYHEAVKRAQVALKHFKEDPSITEFIGNVNHAIAIKHHNAGNTEKAKEYFGKALKYLPNDQELQCHLSNTLMSEATSAAYIERFESAITKANEAARLCGGMEEQVGSIHLMHAEWHMRNGRYSKARDAYIPVQKNGMQWQTRLARLMIKDSYKAGNRLQKLADAVKWAGKESEINYPRLSGSFCAGIQEHSNKCTEVHYYYGPTLVGRSDPQMNYTELEDRDNLIIFKDSKRQGRIDTVEYKKGRNYRRIVEVDGDYRLDAEMLFSKGGELIDLKKHSGLVSIAIPSAAVAKKFDTLWTEQDTYLVLKQNNRYIGRTETIDNSNFPSYKTIFSLAYKKDDLVAISMWDDDSNILSNHSWFKKNNIFQDDHIDDFLVRGFPETGIIRGKLGNAVIYLEAKPTTLPPGVYELDKSERVNIFKSGIYAELLTRGASATAFNKPLKKSNTSTTSFETNQKKRNTKVMSESEKIHQIVILARKHQDNSRKITKALAWTLPELVLMTTMNRARFITQLGMGFVGSELLEAQIVSDNE